VNVITKPAPGALPDARTELGGTRGTSVRAALRRWDGRGLGLLAVIAFIAAWQWYGGRYPHAQYLFSTPSAVARAFRSVVASGQLPRAFFESLGETAIGFSIAVAIALTVGTAMGRVRYIQFALDPLVTLAIATPTIGLLPLMENWFGLGYAGRVSFIVVVATWPTLINTWIGVRSMSGVYDDVGRSLGLGRIDQLRKVVLPAAAPFIFTGLRLSLAGAILGMVLGGQEVGDAGLGGLTEIYSHEGVVSSLIAAILSATALAFLLFWMVWAAQRKFFPWIRDLASHS